MTYQLDERRAIENEVCSRLIKGESLRRICRDEKMPDRETILNWLESDAEFSAKYARARESQADYMDDLIQDVADASTAETAAADRVKIGAYQWRASKLQPKKYGDKLSAELTGKDGGPVQVTIAGSAKDVL